MTVLDATASLAVAEIVFFGISLPCSLYVLLRHGISRQSGWIFLVILGILRLIGGSATLYIHTHPLPPSNALLETATITSAIGTAPLLMAVTGVLGRTNNALKPHTQHVNTQVFRVMHLASVIALVLAIIGGVFHLNHDVSKQATGESLSKAASIIFLGVFVAVAATTVLLFTRRNKIQSPEHKLLIASGAILPFLLTRIIYSILVAFATNPASDFYFQNVNVYVSAFMQFLMEAFIVMILTLAGALAAPESKLRGRGIEHGTTSEKKHGDENN